jgi:glycosyltransferase involved in cell wall biosynthesis/SAM-dependent methyltransferase
VETIPEQLDAFYNDAYYGADGKTAEAIGYSDYQFTAEHGVSWAAAFVQLLKDGGRVLDIGCVDGNLLSKLPDTFERYGIEVNERMAERAAACGVQMLGRDLLDPCIGRDYRGYFDIVTAIAVFEHLADLKRGMAVAIDLLKQDGVLLFELPYISADHDNSIWFETSLEHVFYPSRDSVCRLVEGELGAHLIGRELHIRDFASNYIGLVVRDFALATRLQRLFDRVTGHGVVPMTKAERRVRQQCLIIHAAQSTPDLLAGFADVQMPNQLLLQRIEQLWCNDLRRMEGFRQEKALLIEARDWHGGQAAIHAGAVNEAPNWQRSARADIEAFACRAARLESDLAAAESDRRLNLLNLSRALDGLEAQISARDAANDALKATNDALKAMNDALEVTNDALKTELFAAQVGRDALRQQFEAVVNSTTWKATYPIRQLAARNAEIARPLRIALKLAWWSARLQLRSHLREARQRRLAALQTVAQPPEAIPAQAQEPPEAIPAQVQEPPEAMPAQVQQPPETIPAQAQEPREAIPAQAQFPKLALSGRVGSAPSPFSDDEIDPWPSDRPLVSIVIPCFNYGRFLTEAVDSVLSQTFTDLEVIIVEGGSTSAGSRRAAFRLGRPRVRVIAQDGPHQVGANRNLGISQARGKYICCLDADDVLRPTYIEKAVFLLEAHGYDVVSTAVQFFGNRNDSGSILETPVLEDMLEGNQVLTCAVFRRSLWSRAGGFRDVDLDVTGHVHEDWAFWTRLAALGARIINISREALFLYRSHGPSLSSRPGLHPHDVQRALVRQLNEDVIGAEALARSREAAWQPRRPAQPLRNLTAAGRTPRKGSPVLLLAAPFLILGGAERLLSRIVAALVAAGWRVLVTTSIDASSEYGDTTRWFEAVTAEIYHLPHFLSPERWEEFVRYLIASREVDLLWVVGSAFTYEIMPALKAEFPQLRVADLLFNTVGHVENNRKHAALIDLTFVENQEVLRFLRMAGEEDRRIALVPSGVDLVALRPGPRDAFVVRALRAGEDDLIVGFAGRWSEEKDPLAFVEIARRAPADLRVRFAMTGTGPLRAAIEQAVAAAHFPQDRFHIVGEAPDVVPYLRSYDVLILPSRLDGRPVVVLEALALGVPVIASRVGALPELIEDGVNGFLCDAGDFEGFVACLVGLAQDRSRLARMKAASRLYAERHVDERIMITRYEGRLRGLISLVEPTLKGEDLAAVDISLGAGDLEQFGEDPVEVGPARKELESDGGGVTETRLPRPRSGG